MIRTEQRGPVAVITIDRTERRNAVDHAALEGLRDAIASARDAESRALVLTGAGDNFCAGADLSTVEDEGFSDLLRSVLQGLHEALFPTIAAVAGAALGAGVQLAVACDLRVAQPDAKFGIPAAKLGLAVDQWTVQRLSALAGQGAARAVLLAAEIISGADALRSGLVQREGGLEVALAWADEIAVLAPLTIAAHKLALNRVDADLPDDSAVLAARQNAWRSADLQEGLTAFRERRRPEFRGR